MDGFKVEEKGVGAMVGGLVHVDEALDEGMHVIGGNTVLRHEVATRYEHQTNRNNARVLHHLRE
jgi:hypothetical protein